MKRTFLLNLFAPLLVAACSVQSTQPPLPPEAQAIVATAVAMTTIAENNALYPPNIPVNGTVATPFLAPPVVMISADNPAVAPVQVSQGETRQDEALGSSDPCDKILNIIEAGPLSNVNFKNKSGGDIQLGIYLFKPNSYGQCGYVFGNTIRIPKGQAEVISLPEGEYFAWARVANRTGKPTTSRGNFVIGYSLINGSSSGAPSTSVVTIKLLVITD